MRHRSRDWVGFELSAFDAVALIYYTNERPEPLYLLAYLRRYRTQGAHNHFDGVAELSDFVTTSQYYLKVGPMKRPPPALVPLLLVAGILGGGTYIQSQRA